MSDLTVQLIAEMSERGLHVAVAESLTGGGLTAELTRPAGASAVVFGGVVVYATSLKTVLADVDADLLARVGPVHPEVAAQLADGVRRRLTVDGVVADFGLSTTGVAGPASQGGRPPGTVFVGISGPAGTNVLELGLTGDRDDIRSAVIDRAVLELHAAVRALGV